MSTSILSEIPEPVITAVIPTYRRPALLRRAILSVLGQTYPHVRVCVFDNASGDETEAVVAALMRRDPRVYYHRHHENIGAFKNFSFGMRAVDTPYFSILPDDDLLLPGFYEQAMQGLVRYSGAMFVCMPSMVIDRDLMVVSPPLRIEKERYVSADDALVSMVSASIPVHCLGTLFRKKVLEEIGVFDETAGHFADAGYMMHAFARWPFVVLPGLAGVALSHLDSNTQKISLDETWPSFWESMIAAIEEDKQVPQFTRDGIRRTIYPSFPSIATRQILEALINGKPAIGGKVAAALRKCGHAQCSNAFRFLVWVYSHSSVVRSIFSLVNRYRQNVRRSRMSKLQMSFGYHLKFIQRLDSVQEVLGD